ANIGAFLGTILYSWSVVLSARWKIFDRWFNGLDKAYQWHHITGGWAFLALVLHPIFLSFRSGMIGRNPLGLWWFGSNLQINLGIISLYAMALALPVTVFLRLKYGLFIWVHRVLGLVFYAGFLHAILSHGNMAKFAPLWWYMVGFMVLAMYAFIYHSVLGKILPHRLLYTVVANKKLAPDVMEIELEPRGRIMNYAPGQFSYVSFLGHPHNSEAHPYSMASSPQERNLRFVVKVFGDYTKGLLKLKPGTTAKIAGPYGQFSYKRVRSRRQVWIAGGIGVTPFLAMAKSLPKRGYDIDFFYCVQTASEAHFDTVFEALAQKKPGFKPHLFCQDRQGFISVDALIKICNLKRTEFFICGPPPMMHALRDGLVKSGVRVSKIHFEDFSFK
ncbi:ferredoxin reductase family protein, partial [Candidatus Saccharibacteria bacterium]|nr:ferredoxin reductase family protein [Candidatus Saccharibacteria bacterium]